VAAEPHPGESTPTAPWAVEVAVAVANRAAVVARPRVLRVEERDVPAPQPGQVRVRVEGCGVCGSNLPIWEGRPWFSYPLAPGEPGHEGWGVVEDTGERVCFLSSNAFADWVVVDDDALVRLPPELESVPFPGEALACAINVFRRSGVTAGERVAVVGVGFLGALLVQLAARAGAEVVAVSRRPFALELARASGAAEATHDASAQAETFHCVFEAAGVQPTLDAAAALVRKRGRLVIAGFHQDGPRQVDLQSWNWRGLDVINAHEREPAAYVEGMRLAADGVASGHLDPAPLYTHVFPLERLGDALDAARSRPDGFMKALVVT